MTDRSKASSPNRELVREGYELCKKLAQTRPAWTMQEDLLGNLLPQCNMYLENAFYCPSKGQSVFYAEHLLRCAINHLNSLFNLIWAVKSKQKLQISCKIYIFCKELLRKLNMILFDFPKINKFLIFAAACALPQFLLRVDNFIICTLQALLTADLDQYLLNEQFFLLKSKRSGITCLGKSERPDALCLLPVIQSALDPVIKCVDEIESKQLSDECHLLSVAINAFLDTLLGLITSRRLLVDSEGLQGLYQLLLALGSMVAQLKHRLQIPMGRRLLEDLRTWRMAEAGLQVCICVCIISLMCQRH